MKVSSYHTEFLKFPILRILLLLVSRFDPLGVAVGESQELNLFHVQMNEL